MKNKTQKELFELLSIPSISTQSAHKKDIEKAARWLKRKLKRINFKSEVLPTDGHPVVYAENLKAGKNKPTVLIYGHYDVQSPDPLDEWTTKPFKPEIKSGNIYARGVSDDKGQIFTWITAIEKIQKKSSKLPVNIKFLLEGSEEIGSANLDTFVNQNKSLLEADVCTVSDSQCLNENQPVLTYGLRGISYFEINIKTLAKDVHSGIYGGNVLNPVQVLSNVLSKLKDNNHKILIPGFYDNVRKLSKKEEAEISKYPFKEEQIKEETGAQLAVGETSYSIPARAGARPSLDINGIWGGYQEEGVKTIIPAEVSAKVSLRLVPNQTSDEIFKKTEKFIKRLVPQGVEISINNLSEGEPILMNKNSKYFKSARYAFKKVFGNKPIYGLDGASIPATAILKDVLDIDSILMGYGLPDDNLHSPNEKFSIAMFEKGVKTNIEFLKSL